MIGEFQTKITSPRPSLGEELALGKNQEKNFWEPNIEVRMKD
jgi:hypothetical protein